MLILLCVGFHDDFTSTVCSELDKFFTHVIQCDSLVDVGPVVNTIEGVEKQQNFSMEKLTKYHTLYSAPVLKHVMEVYFGEVNCLFYGLPPSISREGLMGQRNLWDRGTCPD